LREPGLRRRAREQFLQRRAGQREAFDSPALARYAVFGAIWSGVAACFAVGMSLRYEPSLMHLAPGPVVWAVMAALGLVFFLPVLVLLGGPARKRRRGREA
jgi:hypothetical protein